MHTLLTNSLCESEQWVCNDAAECQRGALMIADPVFLLRVSPKHLSTLKQTEVGGEQENDAGWIIIVHRAKRGCICKKTTP